MAVFLKNITFHGILLDAVMDPNVGKKEDWQVCVWKIESFSQNKSLKSFITRRIYLSDFVLLLSSQNKNYVAFQEVARLVQDGIKSGIVQPLSYTAFSSEKAEEAFRFMSSGKHIGKV